VVDRGRVLGAVVLSRTPLDLPKALYGSRQLLLSYAAVLLGVVLVVSILTATTISRPLAALVEQTERIRAGEVVEPLARPGSLETERLSAALVAMAATLRDRGAYITSFARNVSHEFKTPLATILATVELLSDHLDSMRPEERERFLGMVSAEAKRLEALVARLLELARADTATPLAAESDAGAVAAQAVARFRERGVDAVLSTTGGPWRVRMAPETLDSVLSNLLENAREHGGAGVRVCVGLEDARGPEGPAIRVRVADDGRGLSPANRQRAFDAFFTTARERGGTGLGLAIVKSLVEAHGGRVSLESAGEGAGATVTLVVPLRG
jgi:signal transduction histidine kinase